MYPLSHLGEWGRGRVARERPVPRPLPRWLLPSALHTQQIVVLRGLDNDLLDVFSQEVSFMH
jgi:hypothetical protein